jgi:hypothetical protein
MPATLTADPIPETAVENIAERAERDDVTQAEIVRLADSQRRIRPYTVYDIADTRTGAWSSAAFGLNFLLRANGTQLILATWFTTIYHYDVKLNSAGWIILTPEMLEEDTKWSYDFMHRMLRSLCAMDFLQQHTPRKYVFRINPSLMWKGDLEKAKLARDNKLSNSGFVVPSDFARQTFRQGLISAAVGSPLRRPD